MNAVVRETPWYKALMGLAAMKGDHTQQDVAKTMGVSKSAVTNWKRGQQPDPQQVKTAAKVYDADVLDLLRIAYVEEDEKKKRPRLRPDPNAPLL